MIENMKDEVRNKMLEQHKESIEPVVELMRLTMSFLPDTKEAAINSLKDIKWSFEETIKWLNELIEEFSNEKHKIQ